METRHRVAATDVGVLFAWTGLLSPCALQRCLFHFVFCTHTDSDSLESHDSALAEKMSNYKLTLHGDWTTATSWLHDSAPPLSVCSLPHRHRCFSWEVLGSIPGMFTCVITTDTTLIATSQTESERAGERGRATKIERTIYKYRKKTWENLGY